MISRVIKKPDIHTDLIHWWSMDEASGDLVDSVHAANLTTAGVTYSAAGKVGSAITFNGSTAGADVAHSANTPRNTGAHTFAIWAKQASSHVGGLINFSDGTAFTDGEFNVYVSSSTITAYVVDDSATAAIGGATPAIMENGKWMFIVVTYNGGTTYTDVEVWVNGVKQTITNGTSGTFVSKEATTQEITVGALQTALFPFNGELDEVGFWHRALKDDEIRWLYNAGKGRAYAELKPERPSVTVNATAFNGSVDYFTRGADFTGLSGSYPSGTLSLWLRLNSGASPTATYNILYASGAWFYLNRNTSGKLLISGTDDSPFGEVLNISTTTSVTDTKWHHFIASWDLAASPSAHIYLDGVEDLTQTTLTASREVDLTRGDWGVGASDGGSNPFWGDIAQLWFSTEYVNLSDRSNLEKFIHQVGGAVYPVDLGSDGRFPTGTSPVLYLPNPAASLGTNAGTGGNLTEVVGSSVVDASKPPPLSINPAVTHPPDYRDNLKDGLVAFYQFGGSEGESIRNRVDGSSYPLTPVGTPTYGADYAAVVEASTEKFEQADVGDVILQTTGFTVMISAKHTEGATADAGYILSGGGGRVQIRVATFGDGGWGKIGWRCTDTTFQYYAQNDNDWHVYALRYNGATAELWFDGAKVDEYTPTEDLITGDLDIGALGTADVDAEFGFFAGWNRPLSDKEISKLSNPRLRYPKLIGGNDYSALTHAVSAPSGNQTWIEADSDLGASDVATGTISMWVNFGGADTTDMRLISTASGRIRLTRGGGADVIQLDLDNASAGNEVQLVQNTGTLTSIKAADGWCWVAASWDNNTAGECYLYIAKPDSGALDVTTRNNDTGGGTAIDWTNSDWGVGSVPGGAQYYEGEMTEVYLSSTYYDLSVESNRDLFYDSANHQPAGDLTSIGSPLIYLKSPYDVWNSSTDVINHGSGANFKKKGTTDYELGTPP